jgi:hypothetical protein
MLIYDMEVDVARQRPPIPANIRTHFVRLAVADRPSLTSAENEARLVAAQMGHRHGPIVTAVRIVSCVL